MIHTTKTAGMSAPLVLLFLWAASPVRPAEFPLEMKTVDLDRELAGASPLVDYVGPDRPASLQHEPGISGNPLYCEIAIGGAVPYIVRLDTTPGSEDHNRLIVDLNRNGDLRDDKIVLLDESRSETEGRQARLRYQPIRIRTRGGVSLVMAAEVDKFGGGRFMINNRPKEGMFRLRAACYYEAMVELDGRGQRIAFVDADLNQRFGNPVNAKGCNCPDGPHLAFHGDILLRDRDDSGDYSTAPFDCESELLGPVVYFGPKPYTAVLSEDMKTVRIEPYEGPLGEIANGEFAYVRRLTLARKGQAGWEAVTPVAQGRQAKVPVGTYALNQCVLAAKNKAGVEFATLGQKPSAKETFDVKTGEQTVLIFGAPLNVRVQTEVSGQGRRAPGIFSFARAANPREVRINVEVIGAGQETYSSFQKAGKALGAPTYKILDEQGKEIVAGQLEYG